MSNCSCACSLSVEQMRLSWPALVSPDSYIVNQSSFSSINDKDLHKYKNLRNLWVCATRSDCLHTRICWNSMRFDGHRINNASHLMNSPCDCERSIFDAAHMAHFIQSLGWDQLSCDNVAPKLPIFCLVEAKKNLFRLIKEVIFKASFCSAWKNPICLTSAVFTRCSEMTQSKKNFYAALNYGNNIVVLLIDVGPIMLW